MTAVGGRSVMNLLELIIYAFLSIFGKAWKGDLQEVSRTEAKTPETPEVEDVGRP